MGNTWIIEIWTIVGNFANGEDELGDKEYWRGESCILAIWNFIKAKREGHGCVTLYWR